jgi:hypothetical protein
VRISDPKRTDQQVRTLMAVLAQCERVLVSHAEIGASLEINKKAEEAAAETYALAQAQMRNILDDMPRWQLDASQGDRYLERLAEAQHQVVKDQRENLDLMRRPHRRLNAKLQFFPELGAWVAWLGEGAPTQLCLHGVGPSPIEALYAFDENFLKRVPEQKSTTKKSSKRKKK